MLEFKDVSKTYRGEGGDLFEAVRGLRLTVQPGEFLCVVGVSGCGKTTTLRMAAGLESPTSGQVLLEGRPVNGPGPDRCVVFQRYTLFPWRTVLENVAFGLEMQGIGKDERRERALDSLRRVGLDDRAGSWPAMLSGGMQQRVAVARALCANPKVLLMDEPFGALDARTRALLQAELSAIGLREGKTILFITHSIAEALFLADRVVVMRSGPGRVRDILDVDLPRPRDRQSARFRELHQTVRELLERD